MKTKIRWKARFGSIVIALLMIFNCIPFSSVALASGGEETVSVTLKKSNEEADSVTVELEAILSQNAGESAAAMIEISLDETAAKVLQWSGRPI